MRAPDAAPAPLHSLIRHETRKALECGEVENARCLLAAAVAADSSIAVDAEWAIFWEESRWPDAWLIAAVRRDRADVRALDALVARHWKPLFARCELLTLNRERARDLAQETWVRVVRAHRRLQPDGNLAAYLATVATNIWRDWHRASRRAHQLSDERVASLDASIALHDGEAVRLSDALPDERTSGSDDRLALRMDIDRALGRLSARARDVLLARVVHGESQIGRAHV